MPSPDPDPVELEAERARLVESQRRAEARGEAAELDLERAHRLLDEYGVPRERRDPGAREAVEYSLLGRLRLVLGEDEE